MTWTCKCTTVNEDHWKMCNGCGADRPAGLSDMGMEALEAFNAGRRAIHAVEYEPASFRSAEVTRTEALAFWKAARAPLEAENETLREQLGKATEMNHRQANDIGGLEGYLGKDGTAFLHTGTPATAEAVRRIEELEAQLAQAQKPAAKSLADMIAESTTLAMGQRTAALETMIREFLKQTGAKVEDCVLVYQAEREKMTWRIEHRPKGEGGET
jgi:uncharacterized coiled-coil protein SlyX